MSNVLEMHSREELIQFLQNIIADDKIPDLADKILSYPSGTDFIFVCRQIDPDDPCLGHKQQVLRIFHNEGK